MNLGLHLTPSQELELAVILENAAAASIFPKVEAWLQETTDHWNSFQMIAKRKNQERYRCVVDMIFCELFPDFIPLCRAFYAGKAPQLRYILTEKQRAYAEAKMLVLLQVAYETFSRGREISWGHGCQVVEELELAA